MTCQLAFSNETGAVLFSDSQGSTDAIEVHGLQKQLVGDDFLLGGAGHRLVVEEVFKSLCDSESGNCSVPGVEVANHISSFLASNVTGHAAASTNFILVYQEEDKEYGISVLRPSVFKSFVKEESFVTLGSGADLVQAAIDRDRKLGVFLQPELLSDMVVAGENYLETATQSLTVDSQFVIGMLRCGNGYMMGDPAIGVSHAPDRVVEKWSEAAAQYREILAHAQLIKGEIRAAQRAVSSVQIGQLGAAAVDQVEGCRSSVEENRKAVMAKIEEYCRWYDELVGRDAPDS